MRILIFFIFLSFALSVPSVFKRLTGGFRVEKLQLAFPFAEEWDAGGEMIMEAREILSQPFHYLDRGSQCYVFESKDGKYVIKILRFDQRKTLFKEIFGRLLPYKKSCMDSYEKAAHLFSACKLAYNRVRFETGLIYLHLNTGSQNLPVLHCKDALGRSYRLALDEYRFVLQKKADPFRKVFLKNLHHPEEMKKSLDSVFALLMARTAKGLHNSDSNLSRNLGFLDGRAIEIDFGNYWDCQDLYLPRNRVREVYRFSRSLRSWIQEQAPEWVSYIDERMESLKKEILSE